MARKTKLPNSLTNTIFNQSGRKNTASYLMYFERLCELTMSIFKWKNLPASCDERFLELTLMEKGYALFFNDEIMSYLALPCMIGGRLNVYNIPIDRTAYASNGYQNRKTEEDSVIIFNNLLHTNDYLMIENYAKRLWLLDQIIDINANAQKTPVLVLCDEKQRLTMKNLYQKYDGNAPFIFGDTSLGSQPIQSISTGAPFVADRLQTLRTDIWNDALTFIGISNIALQKKERLIKDEVQRNSGGTISSRFARLSARKQACDQINRMFGLNLDVSVREDIEQANTNIPETVPPLEVNNE